MAKRMQTAEVRTKRKKRLDPIDGEKLLRILWDRGCHSLASQAEALGTTEKRLRPVLRGRCLQMSTIVRWCKRIGIDPNEILLPTTVVGRNGRRDEQYPVVSDWLATEQLTRWIETTNGLQYRIFQMSHRHLSDGRRARGKLYDMGGLSDNDRASLTHYLERHPKICQQIGIHPNVAQNLTALPDANGRDWWVIDRWVPGRTLKETLATGPLPSTALASVMRGIAEGLRALHQHGVLRRELSPSSIILEDGTNQPVLTDFELAKLLADAPTVVHSADWEHVEDPYRAPEVSAKSPVLGPACDVYSWGRMVLRSATGHLPPVESDDEVRAVDQLPKSIRDLIGACVAIDPAKRPQSMDDVLMGIKKWR